MPALKIAVCGSAPSSARMAPFMDPTWVIFGCSPGLFPHARRVHAWIEIHRWEPGAIGIPESQKPWLTPEYIAWMATKVPIVYVNAPVPELPNSRAIPIEKLTERWGNLWWTSSVAYMLAMSIDDILEMREKRAAGLEPALEPGEEDTIGLWGVDMSALEEYYAQRPACQHFIELATGLAIRVFVPPESDLLRPIAAYGLQESKPWHIKGLARKAELEARLANCMNTFEQLKQEIAFCRGALDDNNYHMTTWAEDRPMMPMDHRILAAAPVVRAEVLRLNPPPEPDLDPILIEEAATALADSPPAPKKVAPKGSVRKLIYRGNIRKKK